MGRQSVVIVGGGISGLCAAYELSGGASGPGDGTPRIELIEAGPRFGGALATTTFAGRCVDLGADGFLARRPEAVQLVHDLGMAESLDPIASSGASLYLQGRCNPLPEHMVLGVPTSAASLVSLPDLPRAGRWEAWRDEHFPRRYSPGDDPTIGEILRAKFGPVLTYQLIEPMIGGIQAGRVDDLSAAAVFPALLRAAQTKGSLMKNVAAAGSAMPGPNAPSASSGPAFYSLFQGVGSLVDALVAVLRDRGVVLRLGTPVSMLRRAPSSAYPWEIDTTNTCTPAHHVILATPPAVTGQLTRSFDPDLGALADVPSASAAMITLQIPAADITLPPGTGVLVPLGTPFADETFLTTAITFLDRKWQHLAQPTDHLIRVHVGRSDDRRFEALDDSALTDRVVRELATVLHTTIQPLASMVQRWPSGLPQYLIGHEHMVQRARSAAERVGIALCGNAYDGVGIPASVGLGRHVGQRVLAQCATTEPSA